MKKKKINVPAIVLLILLLAAVVFFSICLWFQNGSKNEALANQRMQAELDRTDLTEQIVLLKEEISDLQAKIGSLEEEILLFDRKDALYAVMNGQLEEYKRQYASSLEQIASLRDDLDKLTSVFHFDINDQRELLNRLEVSLKEEIPKKATQVDVRTPENLAKEEDQREKETVLSDARIAIFYKDLTTGYSYSYHADEVFDSASLIKLPYALSLLDGKKADDPEFSEKFTFDPAAADEKSTEGSGVIKNVSEKTEYTYLELFTYMLKYSDNVAFAAIREKYGYTPLVSWCSGHKVKGMLKNGLSNQTASDGAVILEALYDFTENNEEFGGLVKDALLNSTHSVVIPYGVYPKKVVHKYGWADEAYHDMGIVLGEHPYILVVMTDLHQGGKEVDAFLQKIVRMIDDFHNNFYKNP